MKSRAEAPPVAQAAAIVQIVEVPDASRSSDAPGDRLARARSFAEPLLAGRLLDTGEDALAHADGAAAILADIGASPALCAVTWLVYAGDGLSDPDSALAKGFGEDAAQLVSLTRKLVQIQRAARRGTATGGAPDRRAQTERVRKMLLAFSRDLRVVLLRLASRLQTLRWHAASRTPCPVDLAEETLQVFAPLANRLGIAQVKWELEDLSFRFLKPDEYRHIAALVDGNRAAREAAVQAARSELSALLAQAGLVAEVSGRPKHLYSIWKKMRGKGLSFERVLDARALRVVLGSVADCYAALARVHEHWSAVAGEFDDYIARPKVNGYRSLHTVVVADDGLPLEVQLRTHEMHQAAEHGVAAHWLYKESGARGYVGVSAPEAEQRLAEARKAVLRELLAWERETHGDGEPAGPASSTPALAADDERIYVFTPQATIVELGVGATPVDFAYSLHTELGHRCRGARVDGALVPLNTPLRSGQTVEIVSAKDGGPSLDWLNAELGYLKSQRHRAKVRAWFNAQAQAQTMARGREGVEKLLQREGRTAVNLATMAEGLGFKSPEALFEVVGKDEYSLRHIEQWLRPPEPEPDDDTVPLKRSRSASGGGVLVVGIDSLMTTLARCCRPAPPDAIAGYVTRGKGVAIHRQRCSNFRHMAAQQPDRVIAVAWGEPEPGPRAAAALYAMDVTVEASDRQGLLRDISEVFTREKVNVTGVNTQSAKGVAWMTFTVELHDTARLAGVLGALAKVSGVRSARRR